MNTLSRVALAIAALPFCASCAVSSASDTPIEEPIDRTQQNVFDVTKPRPSFNLGDWKCMQKTVTADNQQTCSEWCATENRCTFACNWVSNGWADMPGCVLSATCGDCNEVPETEPAEPDDDGDGFMR